MSVGLRLTRTRHHVQDKAPGNRRGIDASCIGITRLVITITCIFANCPDVPFLFTSTCPDVPELRNSWAAEDLGMCTCWVVKKVHGWSRVCKNGQECAMTFAPSWQKVCTILTMHYLDHFCTILTTQHVYNFFLESCAKQSINVAKLICMLVCDSEPTRIDVCFPLPLALGARAISTRPCAICEEPIRWSRVRLLPRHWAGILYNVTFLE